MANVLEDCVACGARQTQNTEQFKHYQLARCQNCGLVFTRNPTTSTEQYTAIYEQSASTDNTPAAVEYTYTTPLARLALENMAYAVPIPRLIPAEQQALEWLKKNITPGSVVLDCGCGTGRFLAAARQAGFRAVGVEVSPELVAALQKRGYEAMLGEAPSFAWEGEAPAVITFFEVLEHLPEPAAIIEPLVKRFPKASIVVSVPSPFRVPIFLKDKREPTDFPPHHYLRWTPEALKLFFTRMAFNEVQVIQPEPDGYELIDVAPLLYQLSFMQKLLPRKQPSPEVPAAATVSVAPPSFFSRLAATIILALHRSLQQTLTWIGYPLAKRAARRGASAGSLLAIAQHS